VHPTHKVTLTYGLPEFPDLESDYGAKGSVSQTGCRAELRRTTADCDISISEGNHRLFRWDSDDSAAVLSAVFEQAASTVSATPHSPYNKVWNHFFPGPALGNGPSAEKVSSDAVAAGR
jgi:hypothetical protein